LQLFVAFFDFVEFFVHGAVLPKTKMGRRLSAFPRSMSEA